MSSSAAPVQRSLSILRVQIPKRYMTHETWVQVTRRPAATLKSIVEPSVFHSTFKWSQVTHRTKYGGEELVLEGFLKIDQDAIFDTLRRSGSKGYLPFLRSTKTIRTRLKLLGCPRSRTKVICNILPEFSKLDLARVPRLGSELGVVPPWVLLVRMLRKGVGLRFGKLLGSPVSGTRKTSKGVWKQLIFKTPRSCAGRQLGRLG